MTAPVPLAEWARKYIDTTVFLVEADSFAQDMLWKENHKRTTWVQHPIGTIVTVCKIPFRGDDLSMNVELTWWEIEGKIVCFWYMPSLITHAYVAESWLQKTFPKAKTCDAMNFHLCLQFLEKQ